MEIMNFFDNPNIKQFIGIVTVVLKGSEGVYGSYEFV